MFFFEENIGPYPLNFPNVIDETRRELRASLRLSPSAPLASLIS